MKPIVVFATTGKNPIMNVIATMLGSPWPSQRTKTGARIVTGIICRMRMYG
jgi:hypothetical protein